MSWSGSTGTLNWYNKEKQENVPVKLPFRFLVLDQLATIKGYNKQSKLGFYSNEVRNTRKEELIVKSKQGVVYTGFYKNEQDIVMVPKGAEYTQSVYIAHKVGDQWVIGNINMKGSSRSAWFDFTKTCKVENGTVIINKGEVQYAQTGDFYPPTFTYESSTDNENSEAIRLDKELQIYLNQYLAAAEYNRSNEQTDQEIDNEPMVVHDDIEGVPPEKQGVAKALRNWDNVGKGSRDDDAEAASLYQSIAESENVDPNSIPF